MWHQHWNLLELFVCTIGSSFFKFLLTRPYIDHTKDVILLTYSWISKRGDPSPSNEIKTCPQNVQNEWRPSSSPTPLGYGPFFRTLSELTDPPWRRPIAWAYVNISCTLPYWWAPLAELKYRLVCFGRRFLINHVPLVGLYKCWFRIMAYVLCLYYTCIVMVDWLNAGAEEHPGTLWENEGRLVLDLYSQCNTAGHCQADAGPRSGVGAGAAL